MDRESFLKGKGFTKMDSLDGKDLPFVMWHKGDVTITDEISKLDDDEFVEFVNALEEAMLMEGCE